MNQLEVGRQIVHASGITLVYFILVLGPTTTAILSSAVTVFLFLLSVYALEMERIKRSLTFRSKTLGKFGKLFLDTINSLERGEGKPYYGAFTFYLAATVVMLAFSKEIAMLSIAVLAIADSVSTLVGRHFGYHGLSYNKAKSWEGLVSGFLSSFAICLIIAGPVYAFVAALSGSVIESLPFRLNDNITVPLGTAILLTFFNATIYLYTF